MFICIIVLYRLSYSLACKCSSVHIFIKTFIHVDEPRVNYCPFWLIPNTCVPFAGNADLFGAQYIV